MILRMVTVGKYRVSGLGMGRCGVGRSSQVGKLAGGVGLSY